MSRVLATAAAEPSVIRWLHALDPDRDISAELLRSSVRYSTALDAMEKSMDGMPREISSLFIPMYRRSSLVLGQLYGPMSPNTMALALLCSPVPPPRARTRRFVVDLASTNPVEFVEYEWFVDGKLAVSLHEMTEEGIYTGQTIIFDGPPAPDSPVPPRVAMRLYYSEVPGSDRSALAPGWRDRQSSWESWTNMFAHLRTGSTKVTTRFAVPTSPAPEAPQFHGERATSLVEECAVGECGTQMSSSFKLVRMFLQAAGMNVSHPSQDEPVSRPTDRRAFTRAVTSLYEDDQDDPLYDDDTPSVMLLEPANAVPVGADKGSMQTPSHQAPLYEGSNIPSSGSDSPDAPASASQSPNNEYPRSAQPATSPLNVDQAGWSEKFPGSVLQSPHVELSELPKDKPSISSVPANSEGIIPSGFLLTPSPSASGSTTLDITNAAMSNRKLVREHICDCGMKFAHRGHFNAHRRAVHEKIRPHRCLHRNCERYVHFMALGTRVV